tara:strand:+ start:618 stop:926 length:309 start_codon:yes stop_codon:yes gene_type:complete
LFVVIVKFKVPNGLNSNDIKNKFKETAPMYQETHGLIRKNYLLNKDKNLAGGIYFFDTSKNANAWFDQSRIKWLTERYSEPEISYFDSPLEVNNSDKKININ